MSVGNFVVSVGTVWSVLELSGECRELCGGVSPHTTRPENPIRPLIYWVPGDGGASYG